MQTINYRDVKSARELGRLVRQGESFVIAADPQLVRRLRAAARMESQARKQRSLAAALRFGLSACSTLLFWEVFRQARAAGYACRFGTSKVGRITFVPPHDVEQMWLVTEKTRDLRWIWHALELQPPVARVPVLLRLLDLDWHHKHADIISVLQQLRDPRAIDGYYHTAVRQMAYPDHDTCELARKCIWALADLGNHDAFERLRSLADSGHKVIAGYALNRLVNWHGASAAS